MGLFRGFAAPFRGAVFVAQRRLWGYLVLPLLLNAALSVLAFLVAWHYWRDDGFFAKQAPGALRTFLLVLACLASSVLAFIVIQPLLGATFNDRLTRRVERLIRGEVPEPPFMRAVGHAFVDGVLKVALYAVALLAGLLVATLAGFGGLAAVALGVVFFAYDGFDYPLGRRQATFWGKWRFLLLHPGLTLGYGLGTTLLYGVPFAIFVAPGFAAVGATLAYLDVDKSPGGSPSKGTSPS